MKRTLLIYSMLYCLLSGQTLRADTIASDVQQKYWTLQAAWIYNIARFIDFQTLTPGNELIICITGKEADFISDKLRQGMQKRSTLQGKSVLIKQVEIEQTSNCQLVYQTSDIMQHQSKNLLKIHQAWITAPGLARNNYALFSLKISANKLELYLNKNVLQQTDLKLNPSLLNLARPMEQEK